MALLIIIRGYNGSGKTSLAERISKEYNIAFLTHDTYLFFGRRYELKKKDFSIANKNIFSSFSNFIAENENLMLDGVFTTWDPNLNDIDLNKFINLAKKMNYKIIKILLTIDEERSIARTKERGDYVTSEIFNKLRVALDNDLYGDEIVINTSTTSQKETYEIVKKEIEKATQ